MSTGARQRTWFHRSVRALIQRAGGGDPEDIIRHKAKNLVAWAKSKGWNGPPYNPLALSSLLGIKHKSSPKLFSAEAQLTPVAGRQLLLEFNPDRPERRRNFSVCHEIGHTLFDDCYEMVHQRKTNPDRFDPEREVEFLCQVAGAEILMPEKDFLADMRRYPFCMRSVRPLMDTYGASREAVLRRMVGLANRPCALVCFSKRLSPNEQRAMNSPKLFPNAHHEPKPKLRILYSVSNSRFPLFLPAHKSVPDNSCVYKASVVDQVVEQRESWDLPGFGKWFVQAMVLPCPFEAGDDTPTVAALIIP